MTTLVFNGSTQYTEFTVSGGGLVGLAASTHTLVALVQRNAAAAFHDPFAITNSARTSVYAACKFTNANSLAYDISDGARTATDDGTNHSSSTIWAMMAVTLDVADTPDAVFHYRDHTANAAWSHVNGTASPAYSAAGNPAAGSIVQHGRWETSDFFSGSIGVAAAFPYRLTNAQLDELKSNDRTSDWWNCSAGRPVHLVEFNVAESSLTDLTGNSTRSAPAAAPTLTGGNPDRWTFDGLGTPAVVPFIPRRMPLGC